MIFDNLPKIIQRSKKRVGRGHGSGKGKTSGRGYKGQKSREQVRVSFEGGQLPLIKRLPFKRGVGGNVKKPSVTITLSDLEKIKAEVVNIESLIKEGVIKKKDVQSAVKVVATGKITKPKTIKLPVSQVAKEKIEEVGGKVEV